MIPGTAKVTAALALASMSGDPARLQEAQLAVARAIAVISFKAEHDLTEEEFASEHWQALFRIQHPEARS